MLDVKLFNLGSIDNPIKASVYELNVKERLGFL